MGTFGRMVFNDFECFTVERPWLMNRPSVSCIPTGIYPVSYGRYNAGGYDTIVVNDVPGRTHIKFHVANIAGDLEGCIGVGDQLGYVKNNWAVLNSRLTFGEFMTEVEVSGEPEKLVITNLEGGLL